MPPPGGASLPLPELLTLPADALEAVLLCLRPQDIANCAHVCRSLRSAAYSEHLWLVRAARGPTVG